MSQYSDAMSIGEMFWPTQSTQVKAIKHKTKLGLLCKRLVGAPVVVRAVPVCHRTTGVLKRLEPEAVHASIVQRADHAFEDVILRRAIRRVELVLRAFRIAKPFYSTLQYGENSFSKTADCRLQSTALKRTRRSPLKRGNT